eukprot:scaffold7645_cov115-Isochrysis_galbana.AAC.1
MPPFGAAMTLPKMTRVGSLARRRRKSAWNTGRPARLPCWRTKYARAHVAKDVQLAATEGKDGTVSGMDYRGGS